MPSQGEGVHSAVFEDVWVMFLPFLEGSEGLYVVMALRYSRPLGRVRGGASTNSSNSAGVAISQPRVAGEARYPGYI